MSARPRRRTAILVLGVLCAVAACGKKGPPLAPTVRLPAAVQRVSAARLGDQVYITLTIPSANVDRSTPVDIGYVDVYAYTGTAAPPRIGFVDQATRIARVPVAPVPAAGESPVPPPPPADAAAVGATITIVDTVGDAVGAEMRRFYVAVPFSTRNRPGPQHTPVEVRFPPLPSAPAGVELAYTATAVTVTWAPLSGSTADAPIRVNVYRESAQDLTTQPVQPLWQRTRPSPLNSAPLVAPPFADPVAFGVETCYVLRAISGDGATAVEGEPSPRTCVTPVDRFPPAAPAQLVAIASGRAINLLWEANAEPDLAGYVVLRGTVGDARLQPLTPAPITDVRFSDTTVVAGMRYVYAVVAVDREVPTPNVSPESARVEETAQ